MITLIVYCNWFLQTDANVYNLLATLMSFMLLPGRYTRIGQEKKYK